ncbi:MAG: hypothetical protein Q9219_001248 [cf. Caloplaca sp. 3 TL-2023]
MAAADVDIPKQYKAAVYDEPGKISTKVQTLDTPEPGPGEVLINLGKVSPTPRKAAKSAATKVSASSSNWARPPNAPPSKSAKESASNGLREIVAAARLVWKGKTRFVIRPRLVGTIRE